MAIYKKGDKWNNLTLISDRDGGVNFTCCDNKTIFLCDCGELHTATINNVSRGIVKFCKKCSSIRKSNTKKTHGFSDSRKEKDPLGHKAYYTWQAMKRRCYYPKDKRYLEYGGRGIIVCDRWLNSFENFLEDMGKPNDFNASIERIDTNGNYEPNNCIWIDMENQAKNKRNNRVIEAFGKSMILADWEKETGIKRKTITKRLSMGWDVEKALSQKV